MKKLPKTVYVAWHDNDDPFLGVHESIKECIDEEGNVTLIGTYTLDSQQKYKFEVTEA